jgi:hypothetical protein
MSSTNDVIIMFIIMVITSVITGMNMWVNSLSDVRVHLNDVYMGISMSGWMFLLMGLYYSTNNIIWIGIVTIIVSAYLIRNQVFINQEEYLLSMIPHHSMAILMSKKLNEKDIISNEQLQELTNNIIKTQQEEINLMKNLSN